MFLIQLLIPLTDNDGNRFPDAHFTTLNAELSAAFGGLTAYTRSPAVGLWHPTDGTPEKRDDIVVYEVFANAIDRDWWGGYRASLQRRFQQEEVVVHAHEVQRL